MKINNRIKEINNNKIKEINNNKILELNINKINSNKILELSMNKIKEKNDNKISELNMNELKNTTNNNKLKEINNILIENDSNKLIENNYNKIVKNNNNKLKTNINNKINNNIKLFDNSCINKENKIKTNIEINKNNRTNIIKNIIKNKIVSISGVNSKIKIILILMIVKYCEKNKKILIINMDFLNINYIKKTNIINNNNIRLIDGRKIIFEKNNFFKNIEKYKIEYDLIIFNCSHECFYDFNKKLIEISNTNYFLIRQEDYEYTQSVNLFKIYKNIWKIDENKINILVNK